MALIDKLLSHYTLEGASGADSHGSNTLTPINTPTAGAGKVGGAAQFVGASLQHFTIASNASLLTGPVRTVTAWSLLDSKGIERTVASKYNVVGNLREFLLELDPGLDRWKLSASTDGTAAGRVFIPADSFGSPALGAWHFLVGRITTTTLSIQVNNGAVDSTPYLSPTFNGAAPFRIGDIANGTGGIIPFDGRIDEVSLWDGELSLAESDFLWQGGDGLAYPFSSPTSSSSAGLDLGLELGL
jgi:hypothetical protein